MFSVLHISTTDNKGGSGRSAYRIHAGLRSIGIRSRMLVSHKMTHDDDVDSISKGILKLTDRVCGKAQKLMSLQNVFFPSSFVLTRHPWFKEADIIQLYNIHGGYFCYTALPEISKRKRIVWRLSDMWPMTGHCSYSYDCLKWETGCGKCPYLNEYPPLKKDRTAFLWKIKKMSTDKIRKMMIVAPSKWMKQLSGASPVLKNFSSYHIPNGVNIGKFRQQEITEARRSFGIDKNANVMLFISEHFDKDKRKGGKYLLEALSMLDDQIKDNLILLMAGKGGNNREIPVRIIKTGYIKDDDSLARLYAAADIMVLPTIADNLPNTILESMACGTPVVSFNVGGNPEIIDHMKNGYLAKLKDGSDLARGITVLLSNPGLLNNMKKNCLELIKDKYTESCEAKGFREVYDQILNPESDNNE